MAVVVSWIQIHCMGLLVNMPRSPRRYPAESSIKFGAPRDTAAKAVSEAELNITLALLNKKRKVSSFLQTLNNWHS
ncbi:conserved hypothetical protein [Ricinus communis]|uniref:Uncharacterized protein n=1 Tax=Ricinus communis TaxID=3988 RepID=B9REZ3_RICCO|nr:conserved hypothetical protein [Ricinus communis]